jgi:glycerol-3-phosphate acyltransferase PlsY
MTWTLAALVGYALGATPFAYLAARLDSGIDIRATGSGNVGAANVLRSTRWSVGLAVLALDLAKGALAAWIGDGIAGPAGAATASVAAVVGHIYPAWLAFVGGKGVATAIGAFLYLAPETALGAMVAFTVIVWRTKYVSLGSMIAAVLLPLLALFTDKAGSVVATGVVLGGLILFRHRENLMRLRAGTERRFGQS